MANSALQRPELAVGEAARVERPQAFQEGLGGSVRFLLQPEQDVRPDPFKGVLPGSPGSRTRISLRMRRADLTQTPQIRQLREEMLQTFLTRSRLTFRRGDSDQGGLRLSNGVQEGDGVQPGAILSQPVFDLDAYRAVLQQPITGRGWLIVALRDPGTVPRLLDQLERGLEVVHVQADCPIQMSQGLTGNLACVAVMPDESADDGPVLLLDPSLVVLSICPGTGELDHCLHSVAQASR